MTAVPNATVTRNTAALFARASRNSDKVVLPINDSALANDPSSCAFYCVHSISGIAGTDFLDLARRLDPSVRFFGIQAPPREMQNPKFGESIESIAAHYADAVAQFQPNGPLVIGGYCAGAVIALEMADILRSRGRQVGPLLAINGVPENARPLLRYWNLGYWSELMRNLPRWAVHADLMRHRSLQSLRTSIWKNASGIAKAVIGLKRSQRLSGGFAMDGLMDLSIYPPDQRQFINRLVNALFSYSPHTYTSDVVVYEAKTTPLLYVPQIGPRWRSLAPKSAVVEIIATHLGMMHEPYVDELAKDISARISGFYSSASASTP
jgi:thioesterase domain-containing protein